MVGAGGVVQVIRRRRRGARPAGRGEESPDGGLAAGEGGRLAVVSEDVAQAGGLGDGAALTRHVDDVEELHVVGRAVAAAQGEGVAGRTAQEGAAVPLQGPAVHRSATGSRGHACWTT